MPSKFRTIAPACLTGRQRSCNDNPGEKNHQNPQDIFSLFLHIITTFRRKNNYTIGTSETNFSCSVRLGIGSRYPMHSDY